MYLYLFFFSSRRRHTRFDCDWSSDVCSSDLEWRDPFQGEQDLAKKLIRSVGDPNWRFQEDYLRILRGLRFSARFEFRIHSRTLEAAKANAQGLAQLSAERVRDEWFKGIQTAARPSKLVALWRGVGAARIWVAGISGNEETGAGKV